MSLHDAHCHFLSSRFFETLAREKHGPDEGASAERVASELGWDPPGPPAALAARWIEELDHHGLARAMLIASVPGDEESVAVAVERYPTRVVGACVLNPAAPDAAERTRRAFTSLGLRCVCLFPALHRYRLDDERVGVVFDIAAAHGGVVFAHCGYLSIEARTRMGLGTSIDLRLGDPLALAAMASRYPSVPVIVPHFGGGFFREALMAAEACATIHFDTSSSNGWIKYTPGLGLVDVFRRALAVAGPDRMIFGTDSSFFPRGWRKVIHGAQRTILDEIGVEPETAARIFSGNFDRVFGAVSGA
ncbi:MAG: amidohydrolase family protein [Acidobacteriota bacterium]